MKPFRLLLMCLALLLLNNQALLAQSDTTTAETIRVGLVVEDRQGLDTPDPIDVGADGISRYITLMEELGATVVPIPLSSPVPDEIDVVVIIQPARALGTDQTAFLWDFLARGGHLLLAIDPNGHNGIRTVRARDGLNRLLDVEYGIGLDDVLLIESWFSFQSLTDVTDSWSIAQPEQFIPHPITEPLVQYELPVRYWGGRTLAVDTLTGSADTNPMLAVEGPYGESEVLNFRRDPVALEVNLESDQQGRQLLGSIAVHRESGSRIAVVGDSEIFQNIYGQTRIPNLPTAPRYPGTVLFTERLTAWVLGLPEAEWPTLPAGFTWLQLDGAAADWPDDVISIANTTPSTDPTVQIEQISSFRNDQFIYILLETASAPPTDTEIELTLIDSQGQSETLRIRANGATSSAGMVPDAALAVDDVIELRVPRRLLNRVDPRITRICIQSLSASACHDDLLRPPARAEFDPVPLRGTVGPQAFVLNDANLRAGPSTNTAILAPITSRELFAVLGRNEVGDWVFIRNGRYEGWMATFLLVINADIEQLALYQGG